MFKVIHDFADLLDDGHVYHVGDKYPRDGIEEDDARIEELSTSQNKVGVPLIQKVEKETKPKEPKAKEPKAEKPKAEKAEE